MLNNISISSVKINQGVWQRVFQSEFLIASVNCDAFKQRIMDLGSTPVTESVLVEIMADTILLDWRNVKDPQGDDLEYTRELAVIALTTNDSVRSIVDKISTNLKYYCE